MRDFNFEDNNNTSAAANIAGAQPQFDERPVAILGDEEPTRLEREEVREDALSAFRSITDDEDDRTGNTAKIAGAVLVGLLLVGGGIYAYESSSASRAPRTVAMLPPAAQHNATADQAATPPMASPVTTPDTSGAPSATITPPVVSAPKPMHRAGLAAATSAPAASTESVPAATPTTSASAAPNSVVNQPMTLTPQTAPPPEQSAMQQPITAPNVSGQTVQPTPEVANNSESAPMTPSVAPTVQPSVPQPAPSDAAASSTPSPAQ